MGKYSVLSAAWSPNSWAAPLNEKLPMSVQNDYLIPKDAALGKYMKITLCCA